jgi:hypothetical protein
MKKMKNILTKWEQFLKEEVSYSGILKTSLTPRNISEVEALQAMLPEEAIRISPEDLHVTLLHQSILKPFKEKLKQLELPDAPAIILGDEVWERSSMGKKSWAVRLQNQDEMKDYVQHIMELFGSQNNNPEPERVFHVSLANLTGNPKDSVK